MFFIMQQSIGIMQAGLHPDMTDCENDVIKNSAKYFFRDKKEIFLVKIF